MPDEPRSGRTASPAFWALRSRRVVTPSGIRDGAVIVADEKIVAVVAAGDIPENCPVEDARDRVILPGLVDAHVHINEPGRAEWEGFHTATRAAAAGGITTLVDMPLNSSPVTTTSESLELKLGSAQGKLWVDCGFYGGIIPGVRGRSERLRPGESRVSRRFSAIRASMSSRTRARRTCGPRCQSSPAPDCRCSCTQS